MVTSPLGLVPRELEDLWPAAHYDIPVSGEWDEDELRVIRGMLDRLVDRVGYSAIVNHSGIPLSFSESTVIDTRLGDSAGSPESLERLKQAIDSTIGNTENSGPKINSRLEILKSISRFLFGSDKWLEGCQVKGRPPILTITKQDIQMAKWNPFGGRFSFSKYSLPILNDLGVLKKVELKNSVNWTGDIFQGYLEGHDPLIKSGDELLVLQDGALVGSARAVAPGWEWPHGPGKLAKSRHRI